jgi:hypothetical protein
MKHQARDGKEFTPTEQTAYRDGFFVGKARKFMGHFMGTSNGCGFRGRNKLIFNEGLEDGYENTH